jgi:DNA-binding NtrC family response regulator
MLPVLVCVDDEMILLKSLEYELEDFFKGRIEILTAQNPYDAHEIIIETIEENKKIFLIICDHHLGAFDGIEFLMEINFKYPEIQKVLLTGYKSLELEKELKNSINLYSAVEKPWSVLEMIEIIEDCLKNFLNNNNNL